MSSLPPLRKQEERAYGQNFSWALPSRRPESQGHLQKTLEVEEKSPGQPDRVQAGEWIVVT